MTGTAPPYVSVATATTTVAFNQTTDIELDVTADVLASLRNDVGDVSWIIRLSTGAGLLNLGTSESGSPARMKIAFRPDTKRKQRRDDRLAERAAAITDPVEEGYANWSGWAAACELYRATKGLSTNPISIALASDMDQVDRDVAAQVIEDLRSVPASTAAALLGPFAEFDPRSCTETPKFDKARSRNKALDKDSEGHLRAPHCRGTDGSITVGAHITKDPSFLDGAASLGETAANARPVLIGVDPTRYAAEGKQTAVNPELGHTALIEDWRNNAGGTDNLNYPGDGLSPFGVTTQIACSAGSYADDTCNHGDGLLCSSLVPSRRDYSLPPVCLAFPIIPLREKLVLRGHNFWDPQATLVMRSLENPNSGAAIPANTASSNKSVDPNANCTPAANINTDPSLFDIGLGNANTLEYTLNQGSGFYRIKIFNRNGSFRTQSDALAGREAGREIHVCKSDLEGSAPGSWVQGTMGATRLGCTPPSQTCVQDGAPCSAAWTETPRTLAECEADSIPPAGSGLPNACGETPSWFESEEPPAYVFVAAERPTFTHRAIVNRIECAEESGCNNCGGEDEIAMLGIT